MSESTRTLILLRHGQSEWNAKNLFTGWVDVPLTEQGREEAISGGEQLVEAGLLPDVVHTSVLRRAITTANLTLDVADRHWIPVRRSWRLNERHYGALQGKNKKQTLEEYGEEQFMTWRRSFDVPPPPIDDDDEWSQAGDVRYADLGDELPRTECLKDVIARMLPYWEGSIVPDLAGGDTVMVAAHGNSLRGIVKHLDGISDEDIAGLNIPTGMPLDLRAGRGDAADRAGRPLPRPGGCEGRRGGRGQPGPLAPPSRAWGRNWCGRRSSAGRFAAPGASSLVAIQSPGLVIWQRWRDRQPQPMHESRPSRSRSRAAIWLFSRPRQCRVIRCQSALRRHTAGRQPVELLADLIEREPDVGRGADEREPPEHVAPEPALAAGRARGRDQSLGLVETQGR